jgi:glycosyltransferase involved in cell wall biosynthesis
MLQTAAQRSLRLLYVTPRFFPFAGGVESHVYEVGRRLAQAGVQVTVLTTDPAGHWPARETLDGIQIVRERAWPADRDYYFAPGLARHIRASEWDLVHVQSYHTLVAPLAMAAAWRARLPYVLTFHGGGHSSRFRNLARPAQRLGLRPLLAHAKRLVTLAPFETKLFSAELNLPPARFTIIPNGADLPQPSQTAAPTDDVLIGSIGRLERYKGHQRILAAMPAILAQEPKARLWIAGVGPYEATLWQQARALGVADRVEIRAIPPTERGAMATALARVAVMVLLSDYETHPIAVLEALALGRPALVADTSGLHDLVEAGWARAVPLDSTAAQVAEAVLNQLRHPLRPTSFKLPSWDQCAEQLLQLYQTVLKEEACAS